MNKIAIERVARDLQLQIWGQRDVLWPGKKELSLVEILDPAIAAKVLGIAFQPYEELRWFSEPRVPLEEIAGILDREGRQIAVSMKFPLETIRFTGAHEIGHWRLHRGMNMHRDRPIKGLSVEQSRRPPEEREADYFAACFLVPRKRLLAAFQATFATRVPFDFNDNTAFMLCPNDSDSLLRAEVGSLDRALALASAISFAGRHFNSLASQFGVSVINNGNSVTRGGNSSGIIVSSA